MTVTQTPVLQGLGVLRNQFGFITDKSLTVDYRLVALQRLHMPQYMIHVEVKMHIIIMKENKKHCFITQQIQCMI